MAVTGGTILLAIYMLFVYKEPQKKGKAGEADAEQADTLPEEQNQDNQVK
jgi:hypothetical protein